jgi:hypothetical protein
VDVIIQRSFGKGVEELSSESKETAMVEVDRVLGSADASQKWNIIYIN